MLQIDWQRCQGNVWGSLPGVDLAHNHFNNMHGVYIIWKGGGPVVRVGQGFVRDRLSDHQSNRSITMHGNLYVTWAPVAAQYLNGVERYLANILNPVIGDTFPNTVPIPVNLPWQI